MIIDYRDICKYNVADSRKTIYTITTIAVLRASEHTHHRYYTTTTHMHGIVNGLSVYYIILYIIFIHACVLTRYYNNNIWNRFVVIIIYTRAHQYIDEQTTVTTQGAALVHLKAHIKILFARGHYACIIINILYIMHIICNNVVNRVNL